MTTVKTRTAKTQAAAATPSAVQAIRRSVGRARQATTTARAASVKPRSSLTRTSGSPHSRAARQRRASTASREKASRGTAKAISWKSNSTARWMPQDSP